MTHYFSFVAFTLKNYNPQGIDTDCNRDCTNLISQSVKCNEPARLLSSHTVQDGGQTVSVHSLGLAINDEGSTWSDCPLAKQHTAFHPTRTDCLWGFLFIAISPSVPFSCSFEEMICIADYIKLKDSIRKRMDGSSCEKLHILVVTELSPD